MQTSLAATPENLMSCKKCEMKVLPERGKERTLSSSIMIFAINSHCPSLTRSGRSKVLAISLSVTSNNLHSLKIGMFNDHDTFFIEEGLGIVVDELPVHEAVHSVCCNIGVDLGLHFFSCEES